MQIEKLKIGELFAGIGGMGLGVQQVLDAEVTWVSEFDQHASKVLAHRFPNAPNHGDITKIDWTKIEPIDILAAGTPCQDLSISGQRLGMKPGTRSGLWATTTQAIQHLKPKLVMWENVRGAYSAEATSEMEPCPGCVGHGNDGPILRALGRVLGDLHNLGYDTEWHGIRASDIGATHNRYRVFVIAWRRESGKPRLDRRTLTPNTSSLRLAQRQLSSRPSPQITTPNSNPGLLPRYGKYGPVVNQWAHVMGTPPPPPTMPTGKNGKHQLNTEFLEWIMGFPKGHVTDAGINRKQQIQSLGNAVIPQQLAYVLNHVLTT